MGNLLAPTHHDPPTPPTPTQPPPTLLPSSTWRSSDPRRSANNHRLTAARTCVPSLTRTHGPLEARHPFSLVPPSQRADAKLSACQAHKLRTPLSLLPHHYDITPVSHSDDIMPPGSCSCLFAFFPLLPFLITLHLAASCQDPFSLRSQGRRPDCESGSSLVSNY